MRALTRSIAAATTIAVATIAAPIAHATDFSFLRHAPDSEVLPVSWTGFIINPDISYRTLTLDGLGAPLVENPKGLSLGGEFGYDVQTGGVVLGVVGNIAAAWLDGDQEKGISTSFQTEVDAIGLIRGKIGVPLNRWLVFATAGGAFARLEIENRSLGLSDRETLSGWAAGGGIEYRYNKRITLRAEYIYADLGSATFDSLPAGNQTIDASLNIFKFGLNTRY